MKNITIRYPFDRDIEIVRPDTYFLEDAFAEFNAGSGVECYEFRTAKIRSLSVGDLVRINGVWNRVESCGWQIMSDSEVAEYMTAIESRLIELRKVENDSNLPAWFAVNDVVYKVKEAKRGGRFYAADRVSGTSR
jgi:hypothetical protein